MTEHEHCAAACGGDRSAGMRRYEQAGALGGERTGCRQRLQMYGSTRHGRCQLAATRRQNMASLCILHMSAGLHNALRSPVLAVRHIAPRHSCAIVHSAQCDRPGCGVYSAQWLLLSGGHCNVTRGADVAHLFLPYTLCAAYLNETPPALALRDAAPERDPPLLNQSMAIVPKPFHSTWSGAVFRRSPVKPHAQATLRDPALL